MEIKEGIFGKQIRITEERLVHILENHPEMENSFEKITETLQYPDEIIKSKSDSSVLLYYKKYYKTVLGDKWMVVIVKTTEFDSFMMTAYFTDKIKNGNILWKRK